MKKHPAYLVLAARLLAFGLLALLVSFAVHRAGRVSDPAVRDIPGIELGEGVSRNTARDLLAGLAA